MLSLKQSLKKQIKLHHIFKKAYNHGLFNLNYDTYAHKACLQAANHDQITMIHVEWDVSKILPALDNSIMDFTKLDCGFYSKDLIGETEYLNTKLLNEMEQGKTIYIIFNLINYGLVLAEDENWYAHHCTSAILYPNEENVYDFFYFNSHGEDMLLTDHFDQKISRKRFKKLSYKEPIDLVWIQSYITHFRKILKIYSQNDIQLRYDTTKTHNYYGPNLQSGDGHGVCFAFPLIIWYYLVKFYDNPRICDEESRCLIPAIKKLLHQRQLNRFIISCFIIFNGSYKKAFIEQIFKKTRYSSRTRGSYCMSEKENTYNKIHTYTQLSYEEIEFTKKLESFIIKDGTRFIKNIAKTIVVFLTQPKIKKSIS